MSGWIVQEIEWGMDDIGHGLVGTMIERGLQAFAEATMPHAGVLSTAHIYFQPALKKRHVTKIFSYIKRLEPVGISFPSVLLFLTVRPMVYSGEHQTPRFIGLFCGDDTNESLLRSSLSS
jgi:hypothetical protein